MGQSAKRCWLGGHDQPTVLARMANLVVCIRYANISQCLKVNNGLN